MKRGLFAGFVFALVGCTPPNSPADVPDANTLDAADASDTQTQDAAPDVADASVLAPVQATAPFVRYVNPAIGTGGLGYGIGSAFPGPQRPFGLARPGPDTSDSAGGAIQFAHCAGYAYSDTHIAGFSALHMHGTGIVDYGVVGFMPTIGMSSAKTNRLGYLQPFRHEREQMEVGYYRVTLDGSEITTEVTSTDHVALYRVTFPAQSDGHLLFNLGQSLVGVNVTGADVTVDRTANEIQGRVHFAGGYSDRFGGVDAFFVAKLSRPLTQAGVWQDGVLDAQGTTRSGPNIGVYLPIDTQTNGSVTVAMGLSFTDIAHARANLMAEAADLNFDRIRTESVAVWEPLLARTKIEARGDRALKIYYSAVYHTLQMPTLVSDVDGTYRAMDGSTRTATDFRYYSDLSLWDTFRTEHPWLTTVYPEYQRDFVRSLVAMGDVLQYFPRWPLGPGETGGMLGDCGALMMADTYLRGLRDFDTTRAFAIAKQSSLMTPSRREAVAEYNSLGYVPVEARGASASATLEYAYADGALANMATAMGNTTDAAIFRQRAGNYRNLWDANRTFLIGRRRDGTFAPISDYTLWQDVYAEGNAWQYVFYAPHDLDGLATLMGGRSALMTKLDELFRQSMSMRRTPLPDRYYWHGNEPDIHAPFIPSWFDDAATASRYVDWVRSTRYGDGPDGIPGNDDAGTMSAWYTMAALGVFPIAGTTEWLVAAPAVTHAEITLPNNAVLRIEAPNAGTGKLNPRTITWRGQPLARPRLTHEILAQGGTLSFDLAE